MSVGGRYRLRSWKESEESEKERRSWNERGSCEKVFKDRIQENEREK